MKQGVVKLDCMTESTDTEGPGILIVEDEALVAQDIKSRLQQMGFRVVGVAHKPTPAIEMSEQLKPDLLLCDIHLKSDMDGIDVARAVNREREVPVIFLTAYSDRETVARAKQVASDRGVADRVEFLDPEPHEFLADRYRAADVSSESAASVRRLACWRKGAHSSSWAAVRACSGRAFCAK